jgi:PhzF family phenazine biosynthesis protein
VTREIPLYMSASGMPSRIMTSRRLDYCIIDAFTTRPFSGNPAAVVWGQCRLDELEMQQIASEFNLSETAFLFPMDEEGQFRLRWFTPTKEVALCGHATLAAAYYITSFQSGQGEYRFHTLSGELKAVVQGERVTLDFPAIPVVLDTALAHAWEDSLGVSATDVFRAGDDILVVVESHDAVQLMTPNVSKIEELDCRGLIVTAEGPHPFTCTSRMFAPRFGILEDPVTGSAHCVLAGYWQDRLGVDRIRGFQASQRTGVVDAQQIEGRVILSGDACLVMKGTLYL